MPVATPIGEGQAYTEDIWSDDLTIPGTGELNNNGTYTINGDNYTIQDGIDFITTPATYIPEHICPTLKMHHTQPILKSTRNACLKTEVRKY